MARLPSNKNNLNLRTDQYTNSNIGTSTMATDQQEARVLGIPGKDGDEQLYTNTTPVPEDVGGIEAGDTFNSVTNTEMWDKLLYPFIQPIINSFYILNQSTVIEVGNSVIGNIRKFVWNTVYPDNVDSITLYQDNSELLSDIVNDGVEDVDIGSDIIRTSAVSYTWKIESLNTDNSISNRNFTVSWRWSNYFGSSFNETLTENEILLLNHKNLVTGFAGTYNFNNSGYKFICYPASFGLFNSAKDADTGFAIAMNPHITQSITNIHGIPRDYYIYRTKYIINSSINIILE